MEQPLKKLTPADLEIIKQHLENAESHLVITSKKIDGNGKMETYTDMRGDGTLLLNSLAKMMIQNKSFLEIAKAALLTAAFELAKTCDCAECQEKRRGFTTNNANVN